MMPRFTINAIWKAAIWLDTCCTPNPHGTHMALSGKPTYYILNLFKFNCLSIKIKCLFLVLNVLLCYGDFQYFITHFQFKPFDAM